MKILLVAINAKYIHSNLAVYSLRANAREYKQYIELAEFSINHRVEDILKGIYKRKPDILCFSCYIWNISIIEAVTKEIYKLLPKTKIWLGGPEVSYDIEKGLLTKPFINGIMIGEGEETFRELIQYYIEERQSLADIYGIAFKNQDGNIKITPNRSVFNMEKLIFPYDDLSDFENKIIYYETSRGCPYRCSYCLSSIEKTVRLRPFALVEKELQFFLDRKVPQVKFIDRTFNCKKEHSRTIWRYLLNHDNGITNFHFEISADLLEEEDIEILNAMRPGLIQLEIGVQSTNEKTMEAIHRNVDFDRLKYMVKKIWLGRKVHQHLDLIAGLPYENLESFHKSFCDVYAMHPDQLQLGFLKVLKGTDMELDSKAYHIVYQNSSPYEVLKTDWLSYDDILLLKEIEEMVEIYYNSGQFFYSIAFLEHYFKDSFSMYQGLAQYYESYGYFDKNHTRLRRFEILKEFFEEYITTENIEVFKDSTLRGISKKRLNDVFCELLTCDVYLRENSKTRPSFASNQTQDKERFRAFYQKEEIERKYLKQYQRFHGKQLMTMTHMEHVSIDIRKTAQTGIPIGQKCDLLFDYKEKDSLCHQAKVSIIV